MDEYLTENVPVCFVLQFKTSLWRHIAITLSFGLNIWLIFIFGPIGLKFGRGTIFGYWFQILFLK